ncbi:hypothetical protein [Anaerotignum sp.]|uniref:hypothetical protein n=1 Tax=Anaerotignum sp. TaxID=2039241 RepID=UPI0027144B38|nr:hypothetical protein [Anaerotignum sp.]
MHLDNDATAQTEGIIKDERDDVLQDLSSFIPEGWEIIKKSNGELAIAEGDLNNDDIINKAFVTEQNNQSEYASPRNLIIVWGNKDNTYKQSIRVEKDFQYI